MTEETEISQPEDIRRKIDERAAIARGELWERMHCPQSKVSMPLDEYMKTFRGRFWFASKAVMEQAQLAMRIILCPKCIKEVNYGVEGTQFFATVEDDVMTVFPAMGHFLCHWCGFEEYHPLKADPRVRRFDADMERDKRSFVNQAMPNQLGQGIGHSGMFGSAGLAGQNQSATEYQMRSQMAQAQIEQIQQAYGAGMMDVSEASKAMQRAIGKGIEPGMGPIWGMTEDERLALHRVYQQSKKDRPPRIVESKAEAEALLKLAPIERRQAIVQKLRDMGVLIK